ncbi:uncharacterized protein BDV17DRAFT_294277 [Aspergillus undulatus]|uniref:uncharacterized protein n=1 Tax=Aspergillus undulatus TaxID=1810928 RepID=UPI003CCE4038
MRFSSFLLLPLAVHICTITATSQTPKDPFEALSNAGANGHVQALANPKQFADAAARVSLSMEVESDAKDPDNDESASSPLGEFDHVSTGTDESSDRVSTVQALAQLQDVLSVASSLFSLVGNKDKEGNVPSRPGGQKSHAVSDTHSAITAGSLETEREDGGSLNMLKGVEALQNLASLASRSSALADNDKPGGGGWVKAVESQTQDATSIMGNSGSLNCEKKPIEVSEKLSPPSRKPSPSQSPPKLTQTQPVDIFARLEAIRRFSKLAQKLTVLTNETSATSLPERLHLILSDPEVTSTLSYIFTNANKVLTPEALNLLKTFLRSSPLVPDEYRSLAITIADSLGAVFSPEFARHFASVRDTLDKIGVNLIPALNVIWRAVQWVTNTLDPVYIAQVNRQVRLWRKALASKEMKEFVEYVADPETLRVITERISRVKKALTPERICRLNVLFDEYGLLDVRDEEYQAFGVIVGEKIRTQFATPEGIPEIQSFIDGLNGLLDSGALTEFSDMLHTRAKVLIPAVADDIAQFTQHLDAVTEALPWLTESLQDIINLIHSLLNPATRAEKLLAWPFWAEMNLILDKLCSTRPAASTPGALRNLLVATERMLQPQRVQDVRWLLADVLQHPEYNTPSILAPVSFAGRHNFTAVVMGGLEMFGMEGTRPVTSSGLEGARWALVTVDTYLAPDEVEETREAVRMLAEAASFLIQVIEVFDTDSCAQDMVKEACWDMARTEAVHNEL